MADADRSNPRRNLSPLSLHVPEPKFRPGDAVDFAEVSIVPAGETRRPDTATPATEMPDLAYGLVRVLDDARTWLFPLYASSLTPAWLRTVFR